ncbi:non-heme iron oxygenase ferredoxin subunit [Thiofilum flexile]|uniref:non-heme iron oxygenase ferredoxin subunit n=1 Tax=Thiofilum flexile TaxID=125627 RepID=UPI000364469A|nr:non-heme iron oxygenase ferredoxin subunit [Thiofilum flexile]
MKQTSLILDGGLVTDIPLGKTKRLKHDKGAVLLCNVNGTFFAVSDRCTHEDASLYLGCLKGERVHCSLHGGEFCVKTGAPLTEPVEVALQTYVVTVEAGRIRVSVPLSETR